MTPEEALGCLETFGGQSSVPRIYARELARLKVPPLDEAALAERLFSMLEIRVSKFDTRRLPR